MATQIIGDRQLSATIGFEAVAYSKAEGFQLQKLFPCWFETSTSLEDTWNAALAFLVSEFNLDESQTRTLVESGEVRINDDFAVAVSHFAPATVDEETSWRSKARLPQYDPQVVEATR